MAEWLLRVERPELLPLLTHHNRWRFERSDTSTEGKMNLTDHAKDLLEAEAAQKT